MQRAALEEVPLAGLAWRSQGYGMDRRVDGLHQPARRPDHLLRRDARGDHASDDRRAAPPHRDLAGAGLDRRDDRVPGAAHGAGRPGGAAAVDRRRRARPGHGRRAARASSASTGRWPTSISTSCPACRAAISATRWSTTIRWRSEIALRLPRTLELIAAGALLAVRRRHAGRHLCRDASRRHASTASPPALAALLLAVPVFVVGTLLILLFAQTLRLMPAGGFVPLGRRIRRSTSRCWPCRRSPSPRASTAIVFRMTRASVLDALSRDYVRTARAKGLSPRARAGAPRRAQRADARC